MSDFAQTPQVQQSSPIDSTSQMFQGINSSFMPANDPQDNVGQNTAPASYIQSTTGLDDTKINQVLVGDSHLNIIQDEPDLTVQSVSQDPQTMDLQSIAPSLPLAVQAADTLNPANPSGGTVKEVREATVTVEKPQVDAVPGVQYVELEKNPELPPEVDGYLKKVESHQDQIPEEIVIAQSDTTTQPTKILAKPVIVLPITPADDKAGQHKSPKYSLRWLVEWSHKVMKMFSGKVVYRMES
jgi:hypothetical protein